jgi:hypothetical protein
MYEDTLAPKPFEGKMITMKTVKVWIDEDGNVACRDCVEAIVPLHGMTLTEDHVPAGGRICDYCGRRIER